MAKYRKLNHTFTFENIYLVISGFEILAFPCNQFLSQEPGTSQEAEEFACARYKAEYPIFEKVFCFYIIYCKKELCPFFASVELMLV